MKNSTALTKIISICSGTQQHSAEVQDSSSCGQMLQVSTLKWKTRVEAKYRDQSHWCWWARR